jgi:cell division control protein 24
MNIERPVTNISTNANSKSLYQQTMSTIEQLYSLPGFEFYLFPEGVANLMKNNDGNPMIDPVAVLWGCFRLGAPLCHLINTLILKKLDVPDVTGLTTYNNTCKKCIYFFLLACKEDLKLSEDSLFTITELYRDDTNGFVKVRA